MPKLRKRKKGRATIPKKGKAEMNAKETCTFDTTLSDSDSEDSVPLSKYLSNTSQMCDTKDTSDTVDSTETKTPKSSGIISGNTSRMHDTKNASDIVHTTETIHPNVSGADNVANIRATKTMNQMHDSMATNDAVRKQNSTKTMDRKQIEELRVSQTTNVDKDTKDIYIPMQIDDQSLSTETTPVVNPSQDMPEVSDPPSSNRVTNVDTVTEISKQPQIEDIIINATQISHDDFKQISDTPLHNLEKPVKYETQTSDIVLTVKQENVMSNTNAISQTEKQESYVNQLSDLAQIGDMTAKNEKEESGLTDKSDSAQIADDTTNNEASDHKIHLNNPSLKNNSILIVEITERDVAPSADNTTINDPTSITDPTKSGDTVQFGADSNTVINMTLSTDDNLKIIGRKNTNQITKSDETVQVDVLLNPKINMTPIDNVKISDLSNTTDTVKADVDLNTESNVTPFISNIKTSDPTHITNITKSDDTVRVDIDLNTEINISPSVDDNLSDPTKSTETTKCDDADQVNVHSNTENNMTPSSDNAKISVLATFADTNKSDNTVKMDVNFNKHVDTTKNSDAKIIEPSENNTPQIKNFTTSDNAVQSVIPSLKYIVAAQIHHLMQIIDRPQIATDITIQETTNVTKIRETSLANCDVIETNSDHSTDKYTVAAQIGDLLQIIDRPKATEITIQDTTNVINIRETLQASSDVIEIDSDNSTNDAEAAVVAEASDPGAEEDQKRLTKKQRKWLLYQQRLKQKYGSTAEDGNKSELSQEKIENSNSEVLHTPGKLEIELKSNTGGKNVIDPASGLHKYLQLMNLLNKNPEKCKKWLENQENQKKKLRDKYKEPTIYSTVKQIALGQASAMSQSGEEKSKPKVTNSLELLNVLYLNPDKCYSWLKKQETMKKQDGNMYQEPIIYPTVKLIALHHSKQENAKLNQETAPEPKKKYESSGNQVTPAQTSKVVPADKNITTTQKITPLSTPLVTSKITPVDTKNAPTPKITPEKSTPISSTKTTISPPQKSTAEVQNDDTKKFDHDKPITGSSLSKNISKPGAKDDVVYVLFPPSTQYAEVHRVIHKQKQLRAIFGSQYAIPKYNFNGSKSFDSNTSKWIIRIPYKDSNNKLETRFIKFKKDLAEKYVLDWVETTLHLLEKLGNKYQPDEYNPAEITYQTSQPEMPLDRRPFEINTFPSEQFAPQGYVNTYTAPGEQFYQQPSGYYEQNYYPPAADYYRSHPPPPVYYNPGVLNPPTNYNENPPYFVPLVPNPHLPNPPGCGPPMPYADPSFGMPGLQDIAPPGVYPHGVYPPLPGEGPPIQSSYTNPSIQTVAPANVVENKPLELYSDIPLPPEDAINASMNTFNTSAITTAATTQKSDHYRSKDSNETTQSDLASQSKTPPLKTAPMVSVFSMDQCSENVAFRFKGSDIYYPSHIKDKKKRKVWANQQLMIYIKKGDMYTPPEFDNKGKLMPQKIELPSTGDSKSPSKPKSCDPKDAETLTSRMEEPAVRKIMEIMGVTSKFAPVYDKFGMRINPKHAPNEKLMGSLSRDNGSGKGKEIERSRQIEKKSIEKQKPKGIDRCKRREMSEEPEQSKVIQRYKRRERPKEPEEPSKIKKISKPGKLKPSLEEVFGKKTVSIEPPPEKAKIAVKLKKDEKPKETKTKPKAATPAKPASANSTVFPSIRLSHQLPRQLTGIPRAMASTWFEPPETTDNKKVQPAPRLKPAVPVVKIPAPAPVPPPIITTPAPTRKRALTPTVSPPRAFTPPLPLTRVEEPDKSSGTSKTSAFERLGPPTEAKKPKLTINLMFAKDEKAEVVREVVEEHVPVYLRKDVIKSEDTIVQQYLKIWPWARSVPVLKECLHTSRDIVLDEIEMSSYYASKSAWIKVVVKGYPPHFKKEEVLDSLLTFVAPREFIPCFIEFKQKECTFLINRSEDALSYLHSKGLVVKNDNVNLNLTICQTNLTLDNLRFYKGAIFKNKLTKSYDEEKNSLDLSAFQLQSDNSHFMYFPLKVIYNQIFIMNVVKAILQWRSITTLNLSGNRLTSINAFNLSEYLPSLRILDLSDNCLPTVSTLACFKGVPMYSLALEGNPLCQNFIQREHYIDVVKLIFPRLIVLDGVSVHSKIEIKKNFSVSTDAIELVNSFLEIYFTLIDSNDRIQMEPLYSEKAVFSITCRPEMKRNPVYHNLKEFYMWCRSLGDRINLLDELEGTIVGGPKIARYFIKWPVVAHDPHSFTIDIMHHTETSTVLKVTGLFKIPAETLTQDEPIIEFSRTFVLVTEDGTEYKITNDMMYISDATPERAGTAFQSVGIQQRNIDSLSLKFDSPPDEDLKEKLTEIMMRLTGMKLKPSRRCLDMVNWNLNKALSYFIRLEKAGAAASLDF